jgi:hypothetical protein
VGAHGGRLNDDCGEEPDGPTGFGSKCERARLCAAEMTLQSFALLAAAEGAITAHGNDIACKNRELLEAPTAPAATTERRSNAVDMAAFQAA